MNKEGGVYTIPCLVNGVRMNFIFDTGASNVCISLTEAMFLYKNGYISDDDLGEEGYSQVADGRTLLNMQLRLKTIEIGGIILHNVDALVVASKEAPLLLGQTAIQELGKIEINGDSLFIESVEEYPQENVENDNKPYLFSPPDPTISYWDKFAAFFGYSKKINAYLNYAFFNGLIGNELALFYCSKALELDKRNARAYFQKGQIYYDDQQYEKAFENYIKAIELNPKKKNFPMHIPITPDSVCELELIFNKGISNLLHCFAFCDITDINQKTGQSYEEYALQLAQEEFMKDPHDKWMVESLVHYYMSKENWIEATRYNTHLKDLDDEDYYFFKARIALGVGRYTEAIEYFKKRLAVKPNCTSSLYNLALIYNNYMGKKYEAVILLKKAAKLGNTDAQNYLREQGYDW